MQDPTPTLLAALALVAQTSGAVFETELWPEEGRPRFQAVASEIVIRETPSTSAKVVRRLRVTRGQPIEFDETRYRTTESGHVQVLAAASITGRVLGRIRLLTRNAYYMGRFPRQTVELKKSDGIQYLQYRAEGTCFIQVADQVIDADSCPVLDDRTFRVITQPKTEWWIRVVLDRLPVGWAMVDKKAIRESGRSF